MRRRRAPLEMRPALDTELGVWFGKRVALAARRHATTLSLQGRRCAS